MSAPCVTASRPVDMVASKVGTSRVVGCWLPCYEVSVNWNPHEKEMAWPRASTTLTLFL